MAGVRPPEIDAVEWSQRMAAYGAGEILLLTSMDRDGTRAGYNIPLTRAVAECCARAGDRVRRRRNIGWHLVEGVRDGHASAVLAASIFHFGEYSIAEAKAALAAAGLPVRPVG